MFDARSLAHLLGVHDDLKRLAHLAREQIMFMVIDGVRTPEEQKANLKAGRAWTLNSRHLTGHAIDVAALRDGKITWASDAYPPIADAFLKLSKVHEIPIIWGGHWKVRDLGHFELDRKFYPAPAAPAPKKEQGK